MSDWADALVALAIFILLVVVAEMLLVWSRKHRP